MAIINNDKDFLMVKCSCHYHAVSFSFDDFSEDSIPMIDIGFWERGCHFPLPWKQRLRWTWYLLKEGRLQGDDVVINEKDADAIVAFLIEKSKLIKEREENLKKDVCQRQPQDANAGRASFLQRLKRLFKL
jgi:hypothetical protein